MITAGHIGLGKKGEIEAQNYLQKNGYNILSINWSHRHLELDIVASKSDRVIFVEVKTRSDLKYQQPHEFLNKKKMDRLIRAANAYISKFNVQKEVRFDLISLYYDRGHCNLAHFEDVFKPSF